MKTCPRCQGGQMSFDSYITEQEGMAWEWSCIQCSFSIPVQVKKTVVPHIIRMEKHFLVHREEMFADYKKMNIWKFLAKWGLTKNDWTTLRRRWKKVAV